MHQYLQLLKDIKEKGTLKPAARAGMPSTISLFGYQFRHNLADGFPLLTTKEINFKHIVIELLWFLRGDTNIKYLVDNGVNIWNEDAYNYYYKLCDKNNINTFSFDAFIEAVKTENCDIIYKSMKPDNYSFGDCGYQYGRLWRKWETFSSKDETHWTEDIEYKEIDQISNLINGLRNNPESRRHILTSYDPSKQNDCALPPCHLMAQFNCRHLTIEQRCNYAVKSNKMHRNEIIFGNEEIGWDQSIEEQLNENNIPKYYLDCQMYQRSADLFLGVPYNIASYSLLTEILAKMCNMIPGEFIHTFGDVHIYENHMDAVNEQLSRDPNPLPILKLSEDLIKNISHLDIESPVDRIAYCYGLNSLIKTFSDLDFILENYNPHPKIKAKLSTGLK